MLDVTFGKPSILQQNLPMRPVATRVGQDLSCRINGVAGQVLPYGFRQGCHLSHHQVIWIAGNRKHNLYTSRIVFSGWGSFPATRQCGAAFLEKLATRDCPDGLLIRHAIW
jgi:hypothetical protein